MKNTGSNSCAGGALECDSASYKRQFPDLGKAAAPLPHAKALLRAGL